MNTRSTLALLGVYLGCNTAPPKPAPLPNARDADAGLRNAYLEQRSHVDAGVAPKRDSDSAEPASFDAAGVAFVPHGGEWHCIDKQRKHLATILTFDNGPDYEVEGLMRYKAGDKIGFVDKRCTIRIPAAWSFAFPFSNGRAVVCNGCQSKPDGEHSVMVGGKWGYIDRSGIVVVPLEYDSASTFENGKGTVTLDGETLEVTRNGVRRNAHKP